MKKSSILIIMFFAVLGLVVGTAVTQAADSMTGTWKAKVDHPMVKGIQTFVLQQDGEKITGTWQGGGASKETEVTGKIQGSDFELTFTHNMIFTYKGKVEGNKISGLVTMAYPHAKKNPEQGSFIGKKQ